MKEKAKTPSQNTYKFQTFADRIAKININVVRRIGIQHETPEEGDTFIAEGLIKWSELNFTEDFDAFKTELPEVGSLKQLVLNENEVIELLAKHLENEKSLALQPILELVIAVVKDLQIDFYPHYSKFFNIILKLVNTKDVDLIEWAFMTLSYLFKFLWRYMIKDIEEVFTLYLPFLNQNQPEHIRNFAAESFAFLIRKVPDKNALLDFIFTQLENNPNNCKGFGQLLYEVLKGVQQQFHSCIEVVLPLILSKLGLGMKNITELNWSLVLQCELQMAESMAYYSCQKFMQPVWNIFSKCIKQLSEKGESNPEKCQEHLSNVLNVWKVFVIYERGGLMDSVKSNVEVLEWVLCRSSYKSHSADIILELTAYCLLNLSPKLEICDITRLIGMVFDSSFIPKSKFAFVKQMLNYGMFEKDVLPRLIKFSHVCLNNETEDDVLLLFTQIIRFFRPVPQNGEQFNNWKRYNLEFRNAQNVTSILTQFLDQDVEVIYENLPTLLSVLVILPHVKPLEIDCVKSKLTILRRNIFTISKIDEIPFILSQLVTCQLLLEINPDNFFDSFDGLAVMQLLRACPKNIFNLRIFDLVLNYAKIHKRKVCGDIFEMDNLFPLLKDNLRSPFHEVRLLTLRIFSSFNLKVSRIGFENIQQTNVFLTCLAAEQTELHLYTYRERIKFLQKLDWELVQSNIPDGNYNQVPLLYLIGSLFVNFQLLWGPICKLIESHARGMKSEQFWEIYLHVLSEDITIIVSENQSHLQSIETEKSNPQQLSQLNAVYKSYLLESNDRPDYVNHRELLWKTMSSFIDVAEPKNRIIVPLFFQFLEEEYYRTDVSIAPVQDLRRAINTNETEIAIDIDDSDITKEFHNQIEKEMKEKHDILSDESDSDDEQMEKPNKQTEKSTKPRNKKLRNLKKGNVLKTLCSYLSVITKFRNPRAVYRERELREIMELLLTHRNSKVQTFALNFILAYNDNSINKYQTKLQNLLNDKTVKGTLTEFTIDVEGEVIDKDDREKVLPIVLRILFGKMSASVGKNTSGKKNSTKRRAIVMRYLAGAQESELKMFFDLAFHSFVEYTNSEPIEMVANLITSLDPAKVVPLKKIQWALSLLSTAFSKIGNLMTNQLPWLLKLILCLLTVVTQLLERRDEIHPKFINSLKDLRNFALLELVKFFEIFDNYPFSTQEIEAIFQSAVWPQLTRLEFESIYTPTPLLRLIHIWSTNPRYFALLAKYNLNETTISPLSKIMELLISKQTRSIVIRYVLGILENVFTLTDCELDENTITDSEGPSIEVANTYEVDKSKFVDENEMPNYGTLILLPHINSIFIRLKIIMRKLSSKKTREVPESVLTILLRAGEHLTDPQQSNELAGLLFSFLAKQGNALEVVEITILKTIRLVSKYVTDPKRFLKTIAQLFGTLTKRASRVELCELMKIISHRCPEIESIASIVSKLNAWDPKRVEDPNYMERLEGFQNAVEKIPEMINSDIDFSLLIIYNSIYMIRNIGDMSLVQSSTHFLCQMVTRFKTAEDKQKEVCLSLLHNVLLPEIKKGLKSKTEAVRHEFVVILASILRACSDVPKLKDLSSLLNHDSEVDFFENVRHIQIHRRARALIRLAKSDDLATFSEDTLIQFLMPIATSFLFTDTYTKHSFLIDAAIELVGAASKILTWYTYETILKHYLFLLQKNGPYQKVVVRLIVAVLESFHFDLSISEGVKCNLKQPPTKAIKKKRKFNEENEASEEVNEVTEMEIDGKEEMEVTFQEFKNPKDIAFATRIHNQVIKGILPQLNRCLTKKTVKDDQHKLVKNSYPEDDEILRVPLAFAIVKLLQNLPKGSLEQHLPGLFLKLCVFLKSRALSIRATTRDVLVKIIDSIGLRYFPYLLKQMKQMMTKGYQVHVMIYTVHAVLSKVLDRLTVGDLDSCLGSLLAICNNELFGNISEEKEVEQIVGNLREARGCKSYNLYKIMATFVTEGHLVELLRPIKEMLLTTHKYQVVHKSKECLRCIVVGLSDNKNLESKTLLVLSHGLINENISLLNGKKKKVEPKLPLHLQRPDSYLLPDEPKRNEIAKTSVKTNSYILIDFGLQLVYFCLKRGKIVSSEIEHLQMLDPFVSHLIECLASIHVKIISTALRCILALIKFPLPSLKTHINRLSAGLFVILNKYGSSGTDQGENMELVVVCFKVISMLVRDIDYYNISTDHLKVLLTYAEEDITDHSRQATAFVLLRAILKRKLVDPQVDQVMRKVAEMSVVSETDHIRLQCRQVFHQYLFDYPIGKKLKKHIGFFTAQLLFHHEYGRMSALEVLQSIITSFPLKILQRHYKLLFIQLSASLVNDESAVCRKMTANTIISLMKQVQNFEREYLFNIIIEWLEGSRLNHKRLAAQLCGLFVEVEKKNFENRIEKLLPIFITELNPDKHKFKVTEDKVVTPSDYLVFQILNSIMKIINECDLLGSTNWQDNMCLLWKYVHQYLLHPHDLVRLVSSQLIGLLFSHHTIDQLVDSITNPTESCYYLMTDTCTKVQELAFSSISQLQAKELEPNLQIQIIKNLAYIAKLARALEIRRMELDENEYEEKKLQLDWLISKMTRECKFEVMQNQRETSKRSCIFKWLAAVSINLGKEGLTKDRLKAILNPLQREINDNSSQSDAELKALAQEVIEKVKSEVEQALFATCYAELQLSISKKRAKRKADRAQEIVNNPVVAARKRIKKQKSKIETKKRKIERLKPTRIKKKKLKDFAVVS